MKRRWKGAVRHIAIVLTSSALIFSLFRLSEAGSLTPSSNPSAGGTLQTVQDVHSALASDSFDSSGVNAAKNGSAIGIGKCIASRITGGTCP